MRPLLVTVVVWLCLVPGTSQHGYLEYPAQRGSLWREGYQTPANYNDNANFCGGRQAFVAAGGRCGVCGDPYYGAREHEAGGKYAQGIIAASYPANTRVIKVSVRLTTHHKGFFEFRLCPHDDPDTPVTQECLDRNILPIKGGSAASGHTRYYPESGEDLYRLLVELPQGIKCKQCVLHWRYKTGNSWGVEKDGKACLGCGLQEEFRNCADISIGHDEIGPGTVLNVTKKHEMGGFEKQSKTDTDYKAFEKKKKQHKNFDPNDPDYKRYLKLTGNNKKTTSSIDQPETKILMKTEQIRNAIEQSKARKPRKKTTTRQTNPSRGQESTSQTRTTTRKNQRNLKLSALNANSPVLKQAEEAHQKFLKLLSSNSRQQTINQKPIRKKVLRKKMPHMKVIDSKAASAMKRRRFRKIIPRVKTGKPLQTRLPSRKSNMNFQPVGTVADRDFLSIQRRKISGRTRPAQTMRGNNAMRGMIFPSDARDARSISTTLDRVFPSRMIESPFSTNFRTSLRHDEFLHPYLPRLRLRQRSPNSLFGSTQSMMLGPSGALFTTRDELNQRIHLQTEDVPDVFREFTFL